jgi:DNA processing protein
MHDLNDRQSRTVLAALFDPGRAEITNLIDLHGPQTALGHILDKSHPAGANRLAAIALADNDIVETADAHRLAQSIERATIAAGATVVVPGDDAWPTGLDDLTAYRTQQARWSAPWCLWRKGTRTESPRLGEAIGFWGHRVASGFGAAFATEAAALLSRDGYDAVCNGETGIAHAAGQGAVRGGRAFALVAGGIDRTYPRGNEVLLESIARCGAVFCAQPPGREANAWSTRYRDVLLAAMSTCLAAVEVPFNAARNPVFATAAALDRPVFSIAHPYLSHKQIGCWRLEAEGAIAAPSAVALLELIRATCPLD